MNEIKFIKSNDDDKSNKNNTTIDLNNTISLENNENSTKVLNKSVELSY
jgi:hypothetical protein